MCISNQNNTAAGVRPSNQHHGDIGSLFIYSSGQEILHMLEYPTGCYNLGIQTKKLYAVVLSFRHATCPACVMIVGLIILK